MYEKFSDVDIIETLESIVENNTVFYKTDFVHDMETLQKSLKSDGATQNFLFLSRESGTYLFREHKTYIADTYPNNTWLYGNANSGEYQAFLINGRNENGQLKGDIYHLDYAEHQEEIRANQKPWGLVDLNFKDGAELMLSRDMYTKHEEAFTFEHGMITNMEYYLHDAEFFDVSSATNKFHEHLEQNSVEHSLEQYINENFTNEPRLNNDEMQF